MTPALYGQLLRLARRHSRRAAGRADLADMGNRRWLCGVIRNRALFAARGAGRRLRRETRWQLDRPDPAAPATAPDVAEALKSLPASLKIVAALALSGHSRREIAYLLGLSDTALRQRIVALKRRLAALGVPMPAGTPGLNLDLSYGRIRDALLPRLLREGGLFASHDPDGHLFVVRRA